MIILAPHIRDLIHNFMRLNILQEIPSECKKRETCSIMQFISKKKPQKIYLIVKICNCFIASKYTITLHEAQRIEEQEDFLKP